MENLENPAKTPGGGGTPVGIGVTQAFDMCFPWSNNSAEFKNGSNSFQGPAHLTVYGAPGFAHPLFSVWQHGRAAACAWVIPASTAATTRSRRSIEYARTRAA